MIEGRLVPPEECSLQAASKDLRKMNNGYCQSVASTRRKFKEVICLASEQASAEDDSEEWRGRGRAEGEERLKSPGRGDEGRGVAHGGRCFGSPKEGKAGGRSNTRLGRWRRSSPILARSSATRPGPWQSLGVEGTDGRPWVSLGVSQTPPPACLPGRLPMRVKDEKKMSVWRSGVQGTLDQTAHEGDSRINRFLA